jgi:histidinol phosphatase-like enzyme
MNAIFLAQQAALAQAGAHSARQQPCLCSGAGAALRLLARFDYRLFVLAGALPAPPPLAGQASAQTLHDRLHDLLFREQLGLEAVVIGADACPPAQAAALAFTGAATAAAATAMGAGKQQAPALLHSVAARHGIDLGASWLIGALLHEVEAGNRAGCRTVLLDNGSETRWRLGAHRAPTCVASDLYDAALLIAGYHHDA